MPATVVQNAVSAHSGNNDASASTELEVDGTPSLDVPANDLNAAMCTAHGSDASTITELGEDGSSSAKKSMTVATQNSTALRAVVLHHQRRLSAASVIGSICSAASIITWIA